MLLFPSIIERRDDLPSGQALATAAPLGLAAVAAVIHFYWLVKADITRPAQYGAVLALLLGYRLFAKWRQRAGVKFAAKPSAVQSR